MDLADNLEFNLSEDENIIACDKKNKMSYRAYLSLGYLALLFLVFGFLAAIYFMIEISANTGSIFWALFCAIFSIVMFFGLKKQRNNFKFNRIYLTNKRFIVITKDNVESVDFSDVKNIYCTNPTTTFLLYDKRQFQFFCSDLWGVIENFTKIYPEHGKKNPPNEFIAFLLLFAIIACYFLISILHGQ